MVSISFKMKSNLINEKESFYKIKTKTVNLIIHDILYILLKKIMCFQGTNVDFLSGWRQMIGSTMLLFFSFFLSCLVYLSFFSVRIHPFVFNCGMRELINVDVKKYLEQNINGSKRRINGDRIVAKPRDKLWSQVVSIHGSCILSDWKCEKRLTIVSTYAYIYSIKMKPQGLILMTSSTHFLVEHSHCKPYAIQQSSHIFY